MAAGDTRDASSVTRYHCPFTWVKSEEGVLLAPR